ncbi:MAG TPA: hypothetical protein VER55_07115 [Ardenticatenaceae bacterium]|nr:hypothetical protein [Ardenticatenaceae bacterium]
MINWHHQSTTLQAADGTSLCYRARGAGDKQYDGYPDLYHELLNEREPERSRMLGAIVA